MFPIQFATSHVWSVVRLMIAMHEIPPNSAPKHANCKKKTAARLITLASLWT